MTTRIRPLPLEQVTIDMELGADLSDANGITLLAAGTKLTATLLASLHRRGLREVTVVMSGDLPENTSAADRVAVLARLQHLFRHGSAGEADRLLQQIVHDYRLEQFK